MTKPKVDFEFLDGQLGASSPNDLPIVIVGPAPGAALAANTPKRIYKTNVARDQVGVGAGKTGQLAEAACTIIEAGTPVVVVVTAATTAGTGTIDSTGKTGASVVTLGSSVTPDNVYNVIVEFTTGGTVGTAGIIYRYSYDAGVNWSALTALGTATFILLPGGIRLEMTAATLGGKLKVRTSAPRWTAAELDAALAAVQASGIQYRQGLILGELVTSDVAALDTRFNAMATAGKFRRWHGHTRIRNVGEAMDTYVAAMQTAFTSTANRRLVIWTGDAYVVSPIDRSEHLRTPAVHVVADCSRLTISQDPANIKRGRLTGVRICDDSLNPVCFDEGAIGGLDDYRLSTLTSQDDDPGGAYITNARLHSAPGSDFRYLQNGLVMDAGCETVKRTLTRVLSDGISLNGQGEQNAGFITEIEAQDIEAGVELDLKNAIGGHCSSFDFEVSRTDDILATEEMNSAFTIVPLAYPKDINVTASFVNPVRAAARAA